MCDRVVKQVKSASRMERCGAWLDHGRAPGRDDWVRDRTSESCIGAMGKMQVQMHFDKIKKFQRF